jgi:hypothetical protein
MACMAMKCRWYFRMLRRRPFALMHGMQGAYNQQDAAGAWALLRLGSTGGAGGRAGGGGGEGGGGVIRLRRCPTLLPGQEI